MAMTPEANARWHRRPPARWVGPRERTLLRQLEALDEEIARLAERRADLAALIMRERAEDFVERAQRKDRPMMRRVVMVMLAVILGAGVAAAQQIPPPTGPVTFCGVQAPPAADSYTVAVDGGAPVALTMDATLNPACPAGSTHSFQVAAASFPIGTHQVVVRAINAFGTTQGPAYTVTVGIAPGAFTIHAVIPPTGE